MINNSKLKSNKLHRILILDSIQFNIRLIKYFIILSFYRGPIIIRYALVKDYFKYIWLLNNNTTIEKNSSSNLVSKFEIYKNNDKKVSIIGSKFLYYDKLNIIYGIGGTYNKWFAVAQHLGVFEEDRGQYDNDNVVNKIDYVIGASMLVSKDFIRDVGLMCEDYFLYFEELDWVLRGKKKGYQLGYCWKSKVYHKEGSTIGSSSKGKEKSEISDYYGLRNRIVFTKKFYPNYLWSVYLGFAGVIFNRLRRKKYKVLLSLLRYWNDYKV